MNLPESDARRFLAAAEAALVQLRDYINQAGPCDHDVNICVCHIVQSAEALDSEIANAQRVLATPPAPPKQVCRSCGAVHVNQGDYCPRCQDFDAGIAGRVRGQL